VDFRYQDARTVGCDVHLCPFRVGHEGTDYLSLNDNGEVRSRRNVEGVPILLQQVKSRKLTSRVLGQLRG
jgi:hypothetical protein